MYTQSQKGNTHKDICSFSVAHSGLTLSTLWTAARQASLPFTISWSLLKFMSIEWIMSSNYLILCHPLLLLPSIFPRITVFSSELALHIRQPKYGRFSFSFSFSISLSNKYSGLISFRIDWCDLAVQETHESSPIPQFKSISSLVLSLLYSPTLTSIHDYWENHSFDTKEYECFILIASTVFPFTLLSLLQFSSCFDHLKKFFYRYL